MGTALDHPPFQAPATQRRPLVRAAIVDGIERTGDIEQRYAAALAGQQHPAIALRQLAGVQGDTQAHACTLSDKASVIAANSASAGRTPAIRGPRLKR
ncbi:hypothetical protein D3C78_1638480 [compost metagenome]